MEQPQDIIIIGGGIGGLGTAALLAKRGHRVKLFEKNPKLGGRANVFTEKGFTFDMGPSWYLMPDVFEHFFELLGEKVEDHLKLTKLSPSYRVFFPDDPDYPTVDIFSDVERDLATLEKFEPGITEKFKRYLKRSGEQYALAKDKFMYRNYNSPLDFLQRDFMKEGVKMNPLQTMESYLNKWFKDDRVKKILEYTLVFLGSEPKKTPALYNIMNHIDFDMGVYYPEGGLYSIIEAVANIATENGAQLHTTSPVAKIITDGNRATGVQLTDGRIEKADIVISNADMTFTELELLPEKLQTYPKKYWDKQVMGPSAFILYLGLKDEAKNIIHHNLRFATNWQDNFRDVFDEPRLPEDPSYYVSCPTKTDSTIAPAGKDMIMVLVPLAAGLEVTETDKQRYRDKIVAMMEKDLNIPNLNDRIEVERSYWHEDFEQDYNAYKGTALGLAHTLKQTILRPGNKSKKVKNLLYVGAGTNPGIGVPICLISAELAYKRVAGIKHPHPITGQVEPLTEGTASEEGR
jgi:phytoene desaturase